MAEFKSRFVDHCKDCNAPIAVGDSIRWFRGIGALCHDKTACEARKAAGGFQWVQRPASALPKVVPPPVTRAAPSKPSRKAGPAVAVPGCYCDTVALFGPCPVCGKLQGAAPAAPPVVEATPLSVVKDWNALDARARAAALLCIEEAIKAGAFNMALGITLGLAGSSKGVAWLEEKDREAASRGYMLQADLLTRGKLHARAVQVLGFDPIRQAEESIAQKARDASERQPGEDDDGEPEAPWHALGGNVVQLPAPKSPRQLPSGAEPLRAGDWARLGQMVAAGQLTAEEAQEMGAIWVKLQNGESA